MPLAKHHVVQRAASFPSLWPPTKNFLVQNVSRVEVEKSCLKESMKPKQARVKGKNLWEAQFSNDFVLTQGINEEGWTLATQDYRSSDDQRSGP